MAGEQDGGECELDWPTQDKYQFEMMIESAQNESAWEEVDNLEGTFIIFEDSFMFLMIMYCAIGHLEKNKSNNTNAQSKWTLIH